jgi:N-acetylmuramoyl-L-alanine amidase
MPAVLVELGFITNPTDAALMSGSPELFARGIYEGIRNYTGV